jgi:cytochrome d ubiquinol oxidase subunit II
MIDLNAIWYILVGVLFTGYAILDGFDLGVGILSMFSRNEDERRLHLNAIGPFWDGNEVWLVTGGGALFAAFPPVYATVFSGFYIAFMLLLAALIFRAVSIEFYGKVDSPAWRSVWGWAFGIGSLLPAILFGVAFGNILRGLPIDHRGEFVGSFFTLLNPYALLIGVLSLAMFVMHGAAFLALKTEGEIRERMSKWAVRAWAVFALLYIAATFFSMRVSPQLFRDLTTNVFFYLALIPLGIGIAGFPAALRAHKYLPAFAVSAATIASMMALAGLSLFPWLVPSRINPGFSLSAYNASSTPKTLGVMLIIALIGVPLVLLYTAFVYWIFRGKAQSSHEGY